MKHPLEDYALERAKALDYCTKFVEFDGDSSVRVLDDQQAFTLKTPATPKFKIRQQLYVDRVYIHKNLTKWELDKIMDAMLDRFKRSETSNVYFKMPGRDTVFILLERYEDGKFIPAPVGDFTHELRLCGEIY